MEPNEFQNTPENQAPEEGNHLSIKKLSVPLIALIVVILVVAGWYAIKRDSGPNFPQEEYSTFKTDLTGTEGDLRLPFGFPRGTPAEVDNLTESTSMHYAERGVVLNTTAYESSVTAEEAYVLWRDYMSSENYELTENREGLMLYGVMGADELNIIITEREDKVIVRAIYTDRP